jgi:hypothetical protein
MAGLDRGSGRRVISSFFVVDGVPIMFYSICVCVCERKRENKKGNSIRNFSKPSKSNFLTPKERMKKHKELHVFIVVRNM